LLPPYENPSPGFFWRLAAPRFFSPKTLGKVLCCRPFLASAPLVNPPPILFSFFRLTSQFPLVFDVKRCDIPPPSCFFRWHPLPFSLTKDSLFFPPDRFFFSPFLRRFLASLPPLPSCSVRTFACPLFGLLSFDLLSLFFLLNYCAFPWIA